MSRKTDTRMVERSLEALAPLRARRPVDERRLRVAYHRRRFGELLGYVRDDMDLDCKLALGNVTRGGPKGAGMWVIIPNDLPMFGTRQFQEHRFVVHSRRDVLSWGNFETIAFGFAHELAHVVLHSTRHALRHEETATDLATMMLGFSEIALSLSAGQRRSLLWTLCLRMGVPVPTMDSTVVGYLTVTEIEYAHALIRKMRRRPHKRSVG